MNRIGLACVVFCGLQIGVIAQPAIFKGGVQLHDGKGERQSSKAYEFNGPYAIRWSLRDVKPTKSEDPLADYWKPHTQEDPPWVSIRVVDVATRKVVAHDMVDAWESQIQVEDGGKHYLVVTGEEHVAWTIWGKAGFLAANEQGIRKLTAADTGGGTAESAMQDAIDDASGKLAGRELEERLAAIRLIGSRSASADDFRKRWADYRRVQGW